MFINAAFSDSNIHSTSDDTKKVDSPKTQAASTDNVGRRQSEDSCVKLSDLSDYYEDIIVKRDYTGISVLYHDGRLVVPPSNGDPSDDPRDLSDDAYTYLNTEE